MKETMKQNLFKAFRKLTYSHYICFIVHVYDLLVRLKHYGQRVSKTSKEQI